MGRPGPRLRGGPGRLSGAERQAFSAGWLAMREAFDARSRSRALAQRFADVLPTSPRVLELGAGTGSLFRWLAPIIRRDQHWVWLDHDAAHLAHGLRATARWALRLGYAARLEPQRLTLGTRCGEWTVETRVHDLHDAALLPVDVSDAVACSALLDLFSGQWIGELLRRVGTRPFYAAINVTGCDRIQPRDRNDALVWRGYTTSQPHRAGPHAPMLVRQFCDQFDLPFESASSDWHIPAHHRAMLHQMLDFISEAARRSMLQQRRQIDVWEQRRRAAVRAQRLTLHIAHCDLLLPTRGDHPA